MAARVAADVNLPLLDAAASACLRALADADSPAAAKSALSAGLCLVDAAAPLEFPTASAATQKIHELLGGGDRARLARLFARRHYARWAAALLGPFLRDWLSALTQAEAAALFHRQLLRAPPRDALHALAAALRKMPDDAPPPPPPPRAAACAALLAQFVEERRLQALFTEWAAGAAADDAADADALVTLLCSMPERAANLLGRAPPAALGAANYFGAACEQLLAALEAAPVQNGATLDVLASALLGRVATLGHFGSLVPLLVRGGDGGGAARWGRLLARLPDRAVEGALEAALRGAAARRVAPAVVCALFAPLLRASRTARFVAGERLLLLRVLPSDALPLLVALLGAADGDGATLRKAATALADAWGAAAHVTHAPLAQQRYVSEATLAALDALPAASATDLLPTLLTGVQQHLFSPAAPVRKLGMKVAQRVALLVDPTKPLEFDASSEDGDGDDAEGNDGAAEEATAAAAAEEEAQARRRRRRARRKAAAAAAAAASDEDEEAWDAPVRLPGADDDEGDESVAAGAAAAGDDGDGGESDGDESGDDDGESDGGGDASSDAESLPAYDLSDDRSDLRAVARPRHLRQLLAGLRAKEGEHELLQASLEEAERVIRGAAAGPELDALATTLARALLHLSDQYRLPRFGDHRRAGLVALTVRAPRLLAPYLTAEFYGTNHTLDMRMEALLAIHAAAIELAKPPAKEKAAAPALPPPDAAGRTRRWGTASLRKPAPAAAVPLGAVAADFFFPLMAKYDDAANTFRLLGEDCFLLETLLQTLAALLRGAAAYPGARRMALALWAFSWALRAHDEAVVRRGVLLALCAVADALAPDDAIAELDATLDELQVWLRAVATADADAGARELAAVCHELWRRQLQRFERGGAVPALATIGGGHGGLRLG